MSTVLIDLPGLTDHEADLLIRDALYEWATERGGLHSHNWGNAAEELAQAYVDQRYPRRVLREDGVTLTGGYSERFREDRAAFTARKLRAVSRYTCKLGTTPSEEEKP